MEATEGVTDVSTLESQSVRALAKLANSDQVSW